METEEQTASPGPFSLHAIASALAAVAMVVVVVTGAAYFTCGFEGCPSVDQVSGYVPDEASVVVDRNDAEVAKLFRVHRVMIGLDSVPDHVIQAIIATEDRNFYDHRGVDLTRFVGAAWQNIRSGGIAEGGSTITMQVARNVFPDRLPMQERTLNRKIAEVRVARRIESRYSKNDILELYLNQIYFGSGAWGIEAAAQEYFGRSATALDLGQSALLAGLPQAPSRLNPRENMGGALQRRETVLRRMESHGYITAAEAEEIRGTTPSLARSRLETPDRAAYFVEHVRRLVERELGDEVYTNGYRIHTTLDATIQEAAESELAHQLRAIEAGSYGFYPHATYAAVVSDTARASDRARTTYLQGAVISMDVRSGDVLALVGGRDFNDSKFNRATQAERQPGSSFKPFVYAAAIDAGLPLTTILDDSPYRLVQHGQVWEPRNYDGGYAGEISMRQALVRSQNIATVRLAEQVGMDRIIGMASSLGIESELPRYPATAIGAGEVTLLEMVTAYSTLASLGNRPEPRFVTHVTDRAGRVVWQVPSRSRQAVSADVAFLTIDLMRDVVDRGTGTAVRAAGFRGPAAGKTGTTNESADVWFVGATPNVATGVWIGMDEPRRVMRNATGGRLAAPVWGRIMRSVPQTGSDWSTPGGVERHAVDDYGNVVAANCPTYGDLREEYFLRGSVYAADCPGYRYGYDDELYGDTLRLGESEESWWRRLRERVFGGEQPGERRVEPDTAGAREPAPTPRDTIILRPAPRDTIRMGQQPRPDTTAPDTAGEPLGDPIPPDSAGGDPPRPR